MTSFLDYYLFSMIFIIIILVLFVPTKFNRYVPERTRFVRNRNNISFSVNPTILVITILKVVCFFALIFLFLGCYVNYDNNETFIFKNFFLFSKILFFLFLIFFLNLLEYYIKIVNWLNTEMIILFYICIVALFLLIYAENFLNFYLILEMYSLSIVGCIGLRRTRVKSLVESVLKYFFINAFSSAFILMGISIIYANSGLNNFLDLRLFMWMQDEHLNYFYCNVGIFMFIVGLLIKLSVFPFNYWFIDIYDNVPLPFTFFLLIFPKFIFSSFLFIFFTLILQNSILMNNMILYLSLLSLLTNNLISVYQIRLKRIFIASSLSNLPFFILFIYLKTFNSIISFYSFMIMYYMNLFAIFIFLVFFNNLNLKYDTFYKKMTSLVNLYRINKTLSYMLVLFFLSLSGFPPLSGFFGKFYFLLSLVNTQNILLFTLFSIINLITIFVYLRLIKLIFQFKNNYNFKMLNLDSYNLVVIFIFFFFLNVSSLLYFDILFNLLKFFLFSCEWVFMI